MKANIDMPAVQKTIPLMMLSLGLNPSALQINAELDKMEYHAIDTANWDAPGEFVQAKFKAAYSQHHLILLLEAEEAYSRAIIVEAQGPVCQDSCLECFFTLDNGNPDYYNLEINPIGTLHCFKGPNREERKPLPEDKLKQIAVYTSMPKTPFGTMALNRPWSCLVVAPLAVFDIEAVYTEKQNLQANFYKCGDELPQAHYLSWNPIGTAQPDFHQPGYFGLLSPL